MEEPLDVAAEVADIVALTDRWAFKLSEFKADQLAKRMDGLVSLPEPEVAEEEEPEPEVAEEEEPEPEVAEEEEQEEPGPEAGGEDDGEVE